MFPRALFVLLAFPPSGIAQAPEAASAAGDALAPGLVAEYYEFDHELSSFPEVPAGKLPVLVRIEEQIDYPPVQGDFYGTTVSIDFYARWSGVLRVASGGSYSFHLSANNGARLSLAGRRIAAAGDGAGGEAPSVEIALDAGDHALVVELFQGSGQAGIELDWTPPGGEREPVPASALFCEPSAAEREWDREEWERRRTSDRPLKGTGAYAKMDRGTFFSGTVDTHFPGPGSFTHKGIVIRLEADGREAAVCFDTELLKVSAAWTGGFLGWPKGRDGIEGEPFPDGTLRFGTRPGSLGWARDGSFDDPRTLPYGPLPREWGRYGGLYRRTDEVSLTYRTGAGRIDEHFDFEAADGLEVFRRALIFDRSASEPQRMVVCEAEGQARLSGDLAIVENGEQVTAVGLGRASNGASLAVAPGGRVELVVPALAEGGGVLLFLWSGPAEDLPRFEARVRGDPGFLPAFRYWRREGGPSRWKEELVTRGQLGRGPGPYVVDTITVPYENPWRSYMRLTAFDFFADPTRAAVATFDGDVWLVSGIDADLDELRWRRFAAGLFQPLGIRIVEDTVYVLGRDQITRLHDRNGDGEADYYENFNNDCMVAPNFHEFAVNLETDAEGNFYYGKCASWPPVVRTAHEGSLLRVSRDGSELEVIATGLRNPNGLAFGPSGRLALSDNEGHWTPACWVGFAERGDYFGVRFTAHRDPPPERYREPVSFLPRDLDNSIGDVVWVEGKRWGPLEGHLLALSYGKCTLFQVLLDEADGQAQGGVIPFPQRFLSGIMRARFNPGDGQLYVLGMRGWQTSANREGCFQRVRYTGEPVHTVTRARATAEGLVLTFTNPLDPRSAGDARRYSAERWNYVRSAEYGSAEYSVASPGARGRDPVEIAGAELREDRRTVLLRIPGMAPVDMLRVRCRIRAADGAQVSLDIYNSVRQLAESP